jgi:hypothetical protein
VRLLGGGVEPRSGSVDVFICFKVCCSYTVDVQYHSNESAKFQVGFSCFLG